MKPFQCDICYSKFYHKHSLKKHVEAHHDQEIESKSNDVSVSLSKLIFGKNFFSEWKRIFLSDMLQNVSNIKRL